jgi:hypothetical protein
MSYAILIVLQARSTTARYLVQLPVQWLPLPSKPLPVLLANLLQKKQVAITVGLLLEELGLHQLFTMLLVRKPISESGQPFQNKSDMPASEPHLAEWLK